MKKVILAVLMAVIFTGSVYAQSISSPDYGLTRGKTTVVAYTLTSDNSGDVTGTITIDAWVHSICFNPGSTAPTANYDITLVDEFGFDLLDNGNGTVGGTDLHTSQNKCFTPTPGGASGSLPVGDITATGANMGNTKVTVIKFNLWDE